MKQKIKIIADEEEAEIMLIEIGGTVGDIEISWFIEAVRQLKREKGPENAIHVHLTLVPFLKHVGEPKTKPAQRDVALLREKGIEPDILILRSESILPKKTKSKISLFCDVPEKDMITGKDVDCIYDIPIVFDEQELSKIISEKLKLKNGKDMTKWKELVQNMKNPDRWSKPPRPLHPRNEGKVSRPGKGSNRSPGSFSAVSPALIRSP